METILEAKIFYVRENIATSVNGESQYRTNSKTTMLIIFSTKNSFTSCCEL